LKILYIGAYKDGTGYAQAAIDYILSLDSIGIDVVPRHVKLNNVQTTVPDRINTLERASVRGCSHVIQHVLPSMMDRNGLLYNIGLYASETSDFIDSGWTEKLNLMDEIWVINHQMVDAARKSGVNVPIHIVPHAIDTSKFEQNYKNIEQIAQYKNDFIFYTIVDNIRRKNLAALIKAFHLEFDNDEPVQLLIKSSENQYGATKKFCDDIKVGLRLYESVEHYKKEIIIGNRVTQESIYKIHSSCNCFVLPSYGEAWAIPAMDAIGFGKTPIVTACTGFLDYINNDVGWLAKCTEDSVFGMFESPSGLYSGRETWWNVNLLDLRRCMREAYSNKELRKKKAEAGVLKVYEYDHKKIGLRMKGILNGEASPL
jgi:glycosyltransferase involved in cell wall biosynthesis